MALAVVFAYQDWCSINCIAKDKRTIDGLLDFYAKYWRN